MEYDVIAEDDVTITTMSTHVNILLLMAVVGIIVFLWTTQVIFINGYKQQKIDPKAMNPSITYSSADMILFLHQYKLQEYTFNIQSSTGAPQDVLTAEEFEKRSINDDELYRIQVIDATQQEITLREV